MAVFIYIAYFVYLYFHVILNQPAYTWFLHIQLFYIFYLCCGLLCLLYVLSSDVKHRYIAAGGGAADGGAAAATAAAATAAAATAAAATAAAATHTHTHTHTCTCTCTHTHMHTHLNAHFIFFIYSYQNNIFF